MDAAHVALVAGAALAAGAVNAIAGGGSLLTFPALVVAGLPTVTASVTNTVALCPGYLGATWAQRRELEGQGPRLALLVPLSAVGGIAGGLLLLHTSEKLFRIVVPFLILFAAVLLSAQDPIRKRLVARTSRSNSLGWAVPPVGLAAVYGGYFGAGVGIMMMAVLELHVRDDLQRLNALKGALSLAIGVAAGIFFVVFAPIAWGAAATMAVASLLGGHFGVRIARRLSVRALRAAVIAFGLAAAAYLFMRIGS